MTKFFKLFINETIKILKKKSAMILIILAILSLFLSLGFVKLIELEDNTYNNSSSISSKDEIQSEYDSIKKNLEFNSNAYTLSTLATMNARKFQLELALKYDINIYADSSFSDNFWKNDVLEKIYNNYPYIESNIFWLNSFIEEYRNSEQRNITEKNEEIVMQIKRKNDKKIATEELILDKKTLKPTKLSIMDNSKNVMVYILYNEIELK